MTVALDIHLDLLLWADLEFDDHRFPELKASQLRVGQVDETLTVLLSTLPQSMGQARNCLTDKRGVAAITSDASAAKNRT
jgi:hypothetical protein